MAAAAPQHARQPGLLLLCGAALLASAVAAAALTAARWRAGRRQQARSCGCCSRCGGPLDAWHQQSPLQPLALANPAAAGKKRPDPYDTRPRDTYLCWDDYFMAVAFLSAERSKDPNKQVGACIVNDDNIILSIGYNGFPRGCADSRLPWAKRAASGSILDTKYPYVVHAEANALLNKNQAHVTGARVYVTLFPCNECAKLLIQAGIREVVFHEAKLEPTGKRPGTMEQAAAADAAADGDAGDDAGGSASSSSGGGSNGAAPQQKKQSVAAPLQDDSYVASQRLLTMAGVKLRQHTLRRSVLLPPPPRPPPSGQ